MVLVLAGATAACGGDDPDEPAGAPIVAASAATSAAETPEPAPTTTPNRAGAPQGSKPTTRPPSASRSPAGLDAFVRVVQARVPEVAVDRREEEIAAIAQQACASLAAGKDADALVAETRALGTADAEATDQATARELIKLAIDTVCPAQSGRVDEF